LCAVVALAAVPAERAAAADFEILPPNVVLTGPKVSQRLLVLSTAGGKAVADLTSQAKFASANPKVAAVDERGAVRAVGDGVVTITATVGGSQTTARVTVEKAGEPFDWSFRNHVIPVLTKIGCNSGACHGALAGKGGFKLSLRGY